MKKLLLLSVITALSISSFAQTIETATMSANGKIPAAKPAISLRNARTTAAIALADSTFFYYDSTQFIGDSLAQYPFYFGSSAARDSGYFFGTNILTNSVTVGAAEAYSYNFAPDTTVQIIGIASEWFGTANNSANTVKFKLWTVDTANIEKSPYTGYYDLIDLPGDAIDSVTESFTSIGVNSNKVHYSFFSTPLPSSIYSTNGSFYAGYELSQPWSSLGGDTIRVGSTRAFSITNYYNVIGGDTVILVNSAYKVGGTWYDFHYDLGIPRYLSLSPIINIYKGLIVNGIKNNNLTFYGNYPNPAVTNTNIKFDLAANANVTISITDLTGRVIKTIQQNNLSQGQHIVNVNTADLSAGDYIYMVRTSQGGAMACKMTVIK